MIDQRTLDQPAQMHSLVRATTVRTYSVRPKKTIEYRGTHSIQAKPHTFAGTFLPAKSDSDVMFYLQSY